MVRHVHAPGQPVAELMLGLGGLTAEFGKCVGMSWVWGFGTRDIRSTELGFEVSVL